MTDRVDLATMRLGFERAADDPARHCVAESRMLLALGGDRRPVVGVAVDAYVFVAEQAGEEPVTVEPVLVRARKNRVVDRDDKLPQRRPLRERRGWRCQI
jgi:hypothetical protein